jgi:hypothetical protein
MSAQVFTIMLRAEPGTDGVRALRALLKLALRSHGLRALSCEETNQQHPAVARRRRAGATQARRQDRGTKMDMSKYAGSAFLSLDDVQDGPIRGEIATVEVGNFSRPVLTFTNGLKFSLNVTNTTALIKAFGKESGDWIGEWVELRAGMTKYQGEDTPSVLLRPLEREPGDEKKKPPKPAAAPAKAQQQGGDMDDSIPF